MRWLYEFRHLDIRDAILKLLKVIRDSAKKVDRHDKSTEDMLEKILQKVSRIEREGPGGQATARKIDNISTFLLRFIFITFVLNTEVHSIQLEIKTPSVQNKRHFLSNGSLELAKI